MELSVIVESPAGLTWPHWKRLVAEVEALGFAGLSISGFNFQPDLYHSGSG